MAIKKGPSFSGPTSTGWTASTLTPATTTTAQADPVLQTGLASQGWTLNSGGWTSGAPQTVTPTPQPMPQVQLGAAFTGGGGGRGAGMGGRGTFTQPTPLEALLASVFPDAAVGSDPNPINPNSGAPQQSALFRTILGNLGASGVGGVAAPAPVQTFAPTPGAQIASTIPGAPPFLAGAINQVNTAGVPVSAAQSRPAFDAAGLAALAAEQRAQANQAAQEKLALETQLFQQQQAQKKAAALTAQRQRQRFGVNAITSGWANNSTFF